MSGLVGWLFRAAMERIDAVRDLKLADTDIQNLFRKADRNRSGRISYEEFIK
jgi:Ca2+-binding EF-hand superfamily protein